MSEPERREQEAKPSAGAFIQKRIAPLLRESTLWPVWLVLAAHWAAFGAWALLIALEEGRLYAFVGVFGLFWLTGTAAWTEIRHAGRPGPLTAFIALIWITTLGFAFGAKHWGLF